MDWILIGQIVYPLLIIIICLRIVYDTDSSTKAAAYILLVVLVPFIGAFVYFSFGINYRKRKMYDKRIFKEDIEGQITDYILEARETLFAAKPHIRDKYAGLISLIMNLSFSPIFSANDVALYINGEKKFPAVLEALEKAQHHIHIEYYIYERDKIGLQIIELLIKKVAQGVKVRFIYDDFGSRSIRKEVKRMRASGIEVFPFYKIKLLAFANRMNYRNHRKIIVIDGVTGFVGGINVSDKYINMPANNNKWFWRDTHLGINGATVHTLQYLFMGDWNYCSKQRLSPNRQLFPKCPPEEYDDKIVQIVASGPDSDSPLILQSLCKAISLAKKEVLITNPYFIPEPTIMDTIIMTAQSGIQVKILVPGKSDSFLINMANHAHFTKLLTAGVEIYTYQKGFVHAKTMVIDRELAIVGTANMDFRSFDLNFEVNAMIYNREVAEKLRQAFNDDLTHSLRIDAAEWSQRPLYKKLFDKIISLVSPLL